MNIDAMRSVQKAQPFQPFRLDLADGDVLDVPHPEFLAINPKGRTVVVFNESGEMSIIDCLLVSRIEIRNGQ